MESNREKIDLMIQADKNESSGHPCVFAHFLSKFFFRYEF